MKLNGAQPKSVNTIHAWKNWYCPFPILSIWYAGVFCPSLTIQKLLVSNNLAVKLASMVMFWSFWDIWHHNIVILINCNTTFLEGTSLHETTTFESLTIVHANQLTCPVSWNVQERSVMMQVTSVFISPICGMSLRQLMLTVSTRSWSSRPIVQSSWLVRGFWLGGHLKLSCSHS